MGCFMQNNSETQKRFTEVDISDIIIDEEMEDTMSFTIKIEKPNDLQAVISRARNDTQKYNILYEGDNNRGSCSSHNFEGTYVVDGDFITIDVQKKPAYITKSRIEKEIRKYLSQGGT